MNLFLDTETTGLPAKGKNWAIDFMDYPYVVSIAWKFKDVKKYFLIHQEGRKMPADLVKVHGITTKMSNDIKLTQPASFVFEELMIDAARATNIVGHNLYFDVSIIKANVLRLYGQNSKKAGIIDEVLDKDKRIDTMRGSMGLMRKWPKLTELHEKLFGVSFEAHSALEDTLACERCYVELKRLKVM